MSVLYFLVGSVGLQPTVSGGVGGCCTALSLALSLLFHPNPPNNNESVPRRTRLPEEGVDAVEGVCDANDTVESLRVRAAATF